MKQRLLQGFGLLAMLALVACSGRSNSLPSTPSNHTATQSNVVASCSAFVQPDDETACLALLRTDAGDAAAYYFPGGRFTEATSVYYGPSDLQSAYKLPSATAGAGQTVAIVDAYDDPNAESDMAVYRSHFGLPPCTTANGCFKKLNQNGVQGSYPKKNVGWGQEISLDLDMVSAVCPNCHIILVEARSATFANLGASVNTAVAAGANTVSNSYGGGEFNAYNANYDHPGHVITASSGDSGYGAAQPASYSTVVAVGGTSLVSASNARGWSETAWSGAGSGCSAIVAKPSWQTDSGCPNRSEADVSADADPNTGVLVYDSFGSPSGWLVFGGTSVSSPIIASVYALAGNAASQHYAQGLWTDAGAHLFDVTSGSNGSCPAAYAYICNAGPGYDGPTGWGTPNGTTAF